jgi:hypothetical protein
LSEGSIKATSEILEIRMESPVHRELPAGFGEGRRRLSPAECLQGLATGQLQGEKGDDYFELQLENQTESQIKAQTKPRQESWRT